jgi:peroxidase
VAPRRAAPLLTYAGYLPRASARGAPRKAPPMDLFGALAGAPAKAVVAGDVRANENIGLTAVHTLLAREHNRIVARLPAKLPAEQRFQIARRVVGAEIQYITYTQFLGALGVKLKPYRGYGPNVDAGVSNEFGSVGYRAHSMVHGEFDLTEPAGYWSDARLAGFRLAGIRVEGGGGGDDEAPAGAIRLEIPLTAGFGNPTLVENMGLGPLLEGLASERQYRNDEQIDDALRSVLFQVPKPGSADPSVCGVPVISASCYAGVEDLGAIDIERARDHGIPSYNALRAAYGLGPKSTFAAITGEGGQASAVPFTNDPGGLAFVSLLDRNGNPIPLGSLAAQEEAVAGARRTSLASRLSAVYGEVAQLDAFVGMLSEPHVPGTEFGELQGAMWKRQFEALRDGDRFFYANDPVLKDIQRRYGITYRRTLAQLITANTGVRVQPDAFRLPTVAGSSTARSMGTAGP